VQNEDCGPYFSFAGPSRKRSREAKEMALSPQLARPPARLGGEGVGVNAMTGSHVLVLASFYFRRFDRSEGELSLGQNRLLRFGVVWGESMWRR
jgi:hypothetical protein